MCCELTMGILAPHSAWHWVGSQYCLGMMVVTKPSYFRKMIWKLFQEVAPLPTQ